jgi:hypothetical protein
MHDEDTVAFRNFANTPLKTGIFQFPLPHPRADPLSNTDDYGTEKLVTFLPNSTVFKPEQPTNILELLASI